MAQATFNQRPGAGARRGALRHSDGGRAPCRRSTTSRSSTHSPPPRRCMSTDDDREGRRSRRRTRRLTPPMGPRFLDFPLDVLFNIDRVRGPGRSPETPASPDPATSTRSLELDREAPSGRSSSPARTSGCDGAEEALRQLVERAGIPVFMNGQGRGCVPADHRARVLPSALEGVQGSGSRDRRRHADGLPPRLRTSSARTPRSCISTRRRAAPITSSLPRSIGRRRSTCPSRRSTKRSRTRPTRRLGSRRSATIEDAKLDEAQAELHSTPTRSIRCASTASSCRCSIAMRSSSATAATSSRTPAERFRRYEPGCWLDPGPFGCLGVGPGYAMAARLAHPDRQVVVLYGDGAIGFSAWSSRLSSATSSRSSRSSATTASGASRSTRCRRSTATTWRPTCGPASATTR